MKRIQKNKIPSLRFFVTAAISGIVTVVLLCSFAFYYSKTARILTENYENTIIQNLESINHLFSEEIDLIDSIIPLYLSDPIISDSFESAQAGNKAAENRLQIEKQMSFLYYSTSLSGKNFTNGIYIVSQDETVYYTATSSSFEPTESQCTELLKSIDKKEPKLICQTSPHSPEKGGNIYFIRNLFNPNTGGYKGTFIISIDIIRYLSYCTRDLDPSWFICLHNSTATLYSNPEMEQECAELKKINNHQNKELSIQTSFLNGREYFIASQKLPKIGLTSNIVIPKSLIFADLNDTLTSYLLLLAAIIFLALCAAIIISHTITKPIDKMIYNINQISEGRQHTFPPMKLYREFDVWAESFNKMLRQLDTYYNDNFQKQLLLKNAEIRALRTQMNPHFLLNVLNTIAWKAQINNNEEIYQMVISLGEFLKAHTVLKDEDCISLEQEMKYVKFYIYLQQQRFEDKISCDIRIPKPLMTCMIPCFSIQPLVENAIVHGLEPKIEKGKLIIQILETDDNYMEISIIDNGVGFKEEINVHDILLSETDAHTHIGLKNLDKRLYLLYGGESRLKIDSVPDIYTSVSFRIPLTKE